MEKEMFLTDRQIAERYSVSRATVWRWVKEKRLPAPARLGPATTRWRESDLKAFEQAAT